MIRILLISLLFGSLLSAQELDLRAPNAHFDFVDQTQAVRHSCGPASLINSFGSGSPEWQKVLGKIPAGNDQFRIGTVIKTWGLKPSTTSKDQKRWQLRRGVNFIDLVQIANEMKGRNWKLPAIESEFFFTNSPADAERQLRLAHKRFKKSLKKGLPPIISIRRFVLREKQWQSVHGHFVVLNALPSRLPRGAKSFPIHFIDPIEAKRYEAEVTILPGEQLLPCLFLDCGENKVGRKHVQKNEKNVLGLAGAIGIW